jgi:hypothetical protein
MVRALAASLPVIVMTAGILGFIVSESGGRTPLSYGPARNVAEAAAWGNAAETLRQLSLGQDPTRIQPIRAEVLSSAIRQITALEAAVWSRQLALVQLLDERGMIVGDERRRLACLAADINAGDIRDYLSMPEPPACQPQQVYEDVLARTKKDEED